MLNNAYGHIGADNIISRLCEKRFPAKTTHVQRVSDNCILILELGVNGKKITRRLEML